MNWLLITVVAYFLIALESILDKFLLSSQRVAHPATYAFYSGLLSLTAFLFFPWGFHWISLTTAWQEILAGAIFTFGILFLFFAIKNSEASQVIPVVGAVTTIVTFLLSFIFLGEHLLILKFWGIIILIIGGLLISLDFSAERLKHFFDGFSFSVLAGFFLAVAYTWFKYFYEADNFINVYIWTRLGLMLGASSFFLYAPWRKIIWSSLVKFKKPPTQNQRSGVLFVATKALGGVGSFLLNYSISLGSVTIINSMVAVEYVFIFGLAYLFFKKGNKIFAEKRDKATLVRKLVAVCIIAIGMFCVNM